MKNWYELNVPVDLDQVGKDKKYLGRIIRHIRILISFGWTGCALNMRINKSNFQNLKKYSKMFPEVLSAIVKRIKTDKDDDVLESGFSLKISEEENPFINKSFKVMSRLTFCCDIKNFQSKLREASLSRSSNLDFLDIMAIEPTGNKDITSIVEKLNIDLISLNRIKSVVYMRKKILVGCKRGIMLSIDYQRALSDQSSFYSFFSKYSSAIRATKGLKFLVLSNGTSDVKYVRSPLDVANIAQLFGLDVSVGKKMISDNCEKVFEHSEKVRKTVKGAIKITSIDLEKEDEKKKSQDVKMDEKDDSSQNRKRKFGEIE